MYLVDVGETHTSSSFGGSKPSSALSERQHIPRSATLCIVVNTQTPRRKHVHYRSQFLALKCPHTDLESRAAFYRQSTKASRATLDLIPDDAPWSAPGRVRKSYTLADDPCEQDGLHIAS